MKGQMDLGFKPKKIKAMFSLSENIVEKLDKHAIMAGLNKSVIVTLALDEYFKKQEKEKK